MLIFGRLGAPALGLPGSGTATALVAWAMATALAIHIRHAKLLPVMPMSLAELWHGLCEVTALGVPIAGVWLLEIGMFSASSLLMGRFGPVALAAHQICINLVSLTFTVPSAISTAATVRLGFHMGARAPAEARVAAGAALAIGVAFMALVAIALNLFARPIIRLYLAADDPALPQVLSLGTGMLTVAALFQVFDATQCVAAGALRGLLDVRMPLLIGVVGYWLLGLPIGAALAFATPLGPIGLWCGLAAGLVLVAAMLATRLRRRMGALSAQLPPAASGLGALAKP
jgi:MATE family multidrug resistance protein